MVLLVKVLPVGIGDKDGGWREFLGFLDLEAVLRGGVRWSIDGGTRESRCDASSRVGMAENARRNDFPA